MLNVLGLLIDVEAEQMELLTSVRQGRLISVDDLADARVLPVPSAARKVPKSWLDNVSDKPALW